MSSQIENGISHPEYVKDQLDDLINHLRQDVEKLEDPQGRALFETSAEVLEGLKRAFTHYQQKSEMAWR